MPAAAVIPAPVVYTSFVAIKKLVVGYLVGAISLILCIRTCIVSDHPWGEPVWH